MADNNYEESGTAPSGMFPNGSDQPCEGYYKDPQGRVYYLYNDGAAFYCDQNGQPFSDGYMGNINETCELASLVLASAGVTQDIATDSAFTVTQTQNTTDFALADPSYIPQRNTLWWERSRCKRWEEQKREYLEETEARRSDPDQYLTIAYLDQKQRGQLFTILFTVGIFAIIAAGVIIVKKKEKLLLTLFKNNIEMVLVDGGTFNMGCTKEQDKECDDNEKPVHSVSVSNFYIGKYEVTQEQWIMVLGDNPSYFKGMDLPVEEVDWDDVQKFIKKLNLITGKHYRLPTEAEWEYAARGGTQSKNYKYAGGNYPDGIMWNKDNSDGKTHPVGGKQPNELGIYDMSGNVMEWVSDWLGKYSSSAVTNPKGPDDGWKGRVRRGGCWDYKAKDCRVSVRRGITLNIFSNGGVIGLRLAHSQ